MKTLIKYCTSYHFVLTSHKIPKEHPNSLFKKKKEKKEIVSLLISFYVTCG